MGCVCCSLSSFISILLHSLERITLCTVCAALTCCILFTILSVLVMGIGIGFHYCEVQNSVAAMAAAAKAASSLEDRRSGGGKVGGGLESRKQEMMRSVGQAVKRGFAHRLGRRHRDMLMPSNNNTVNDRILRAINSSLNGTLPDHGKMSEFAQRFAKTDLGLDFKNNTANIQKITRNLNATATLLEHGFNDTLSLLAEKIIGSSRRTKRDLVNPANETMIGNLTEPLNDTLETVDNFANISYLIFENYEMGSNSSGAVDEKIEALLDGGLASTANTSMQHLKSLRQNCTLFNFFSLFF